MNVTIGRKLSLLAGFTLLLVTAIGVVAERAINAANSGMEVMYRDNMVPTTMLATVDDGLTDSLKQILLASYHDPRLEENELHEKDHPVSRHTETAEKRGEEIARVWKAFLDLGNHSVEENKIADQVDRDLGAFLHEGVQRSVELLKHGQFRESNEHIDFVVNPLGKRVKDGLNALVGYQVRESAATYGAAENRYARIKSFLLAGIPVVIIVTALLAYWVVFSITRPVVRLAAAARQIARGDLSSNLEFKRQDEIGALADSFLDMVGYLKQMSRAAEVIARGDLRGEVQPKSGGDVLGRRLSEHGDQIAERHHRHPRRCGSDGRGRGADRGNIGAIRAQQRSGRRRRGANDGHDARDVGEHP